jgi:hypothetical protein
MPVMNLPQLPVGPGSVDKCVSLYLNRLPADDALWPRASHRCNDGFVLNVLSFPVGGHSCNGGMIPLHRDPPPRIYRGLNASGRGNGEFIRETPCITLPD